MKLTVVVDNCVPINTVDPFLGEHGSSLLIETGKEKILVDTGQSSAVIHNLSLLGVHPQDLDAVVLSHGHFDHVGGLVYILKHRKTKIPVYAHPDIFTCRYSASRGKKRYVGIPQTKEELTLLGADWHFSSEPREIYPNLWFSGNIPRTAEFETGDINLKIADAAGCECQDLLQDDISLFYSNGNGLVVIGGCTHSGLVNTVRYGLQITKQEQLVGWFGGTHLGPVSSEQQNKTLAFLEEQSPGFIAASHCTGFAMMSELSQRFGNKFVPAFISTVIEC